jgi:hypothetical protein
MAQYQTRTYQIGNFTATLSRPGMSAAEKVQALVEAISTEIDNTLPGKPPSTPGRPDQGLPSGGHPDQSLPGGGSVDNSLPGAELAKFLKAHAKELAAEALKGTLCDPAKPK